jgi:thiamine-phosphate pyrophosphorylase
LPKLLFFTDPARTPEPALIAARLPPGAAVVYRAFGARDALVRGRELAKVARRRRLVFLVGADAGLAARLMADGVHLPERASVRARSLKRLRPGWLVTCAAHSLPAALAAKGAGADAVVVSPVFESRSPSAGRPLGPLRFAQIARRIGGPVYALGGLNPATAQSLTGSGAVGFAAVEALSN